MTRGRKPTPTNLRVLRGNPGKRPLNKAEPKPRAKAPGCPAHLSPPAKAEWRRLCRAYAPLNMLTELDRGTLAAYCQAYGRWVQAERAMQEYGVIEVTPNGNQVHGIYLQIANRAMEQMRALAPELGLTPSSRSRIGAVTEPAADDFDAYLNRA